MPAPKGTGFPRKWTVEELYSVATEVVVHITGRRATDKVVRAEYEDEVQDMVFAAQRKFAAKAATKSLVQSTMRTAFARAQEKKFKLSTVPLTEVSGATGTEVLERVEEREDARQKLSEALSSIDATDSERQVVAALITANLDREVAAQALGVSRGAIDTALSRITAKAKELGTKTHEPGVSKPGVPQGSEAGALGSSVLTESVAAQAQSNRFETEKLLSGVRSESNAAAHASRPGSSQRPAAHGPVGAVPDVPQHPGKDSEQVEAEANRRALAEALGVSTGEVAGTLYHYFAERGRQEPYAEQQEDGSYRPKNSYLTPQAVQDHLDGFRTLGVYSTKEDNTVGWVCWDFDTATAEEDSFALALTLDGTYLIEFSGRKGYHVWQFFSAPTSAGAALAYGRSVASRAGVECEVFPKQADVHGGLGNLVKLPGGIHRVSGKRTEIVAGTLGTISSPQGEAHAAKGEPERVTTPAGSSAVDGWIPEMFNGGLSEGGRNNTMNRFVVWMLACGVAPDVVEATTRFVNETYCQPPLDERELGLLLRPRRGVVVGKAA